MADPAPLEARYRLVESSCRVGSRNRLSSVADCAENEEASSFGFQRPDDLLTYRSHEPSCDDQLGSAVSTLSAEHFLLNAIRERAKMRSEPVE